MKRIHLLGLALVTAWAVAALAAPPPFPDFSGTSEVKSGSMTVAAPVAASGSRIRYEMEVSGQKSTVVHDYEKRRSWSATPAGCVDYAWPADGSFPPGTQIAWPKEEAVGEETVDGHPAKKFRVTTEHAGKTYTGIIWRATDLDGFLIRYRDEKGAYESNFRDIEKGPQDAKQFEAPADCKKM